MEAIDAIKDIRAQTRCPLKQAKEAYEQFGNVADAVKSLGGNFVMFEKRLLEDLVAAARGLVDYINRTADENSLRVKTSREIPGFFPAVGKLEAALAKVEGQGLDGSTHHG